MGFGTLLFIIGMFVVSVIVQIFVLKWSAKVAYKRKVSFGQAMVQWMFVIFSQFIIWVIMFLLMFSVLLGVSIVGG